MDTTPSNVAKAAPNEPRDLLARLYREIGISAVAAALKVHAMAEENAPADGEASLAGARRSQAA